ncbi:TetR/AcrR family transcriptional regulator [Bacillus sp. B190/17]|uniref:TetR/AcrR family transcriptional regulator n=1 Tax=Bacillus lumedeiriae TaxID=3058829 RepID=A0ABW8I6U1_9BACI
MLSKRSNEHDCSIQETKQMIIHTAQKLFMTYGYRSVSTRQIAETCGVTQPALYHHFQNKKTIYIEVVKSIMQRTKADLYHIKNHYSTFKDRLYQIAYYMLMNHQEDLTQMFHDLQHEMDEDTQILIREWWLDSYLNPVVFIIEEAVHKEQIRDLTAIGSNIMEIALFILDLMKSFLQSPAHRQLNDSKRREEAERKAKLIVTIFLEGISG